MFTLITMGSTDAVASAAKPARARTAFDANENRVMMILSKNAVGTIDESDPGSKWGWVDARWAAKCLLLWSR